MNKLPWFLFLPILVSCAKLPQVKHRPFNEKEADVLVEETIQAYKHDEKSQVSQPQSLRPLKLNRRVKKWLHYYSVKSHARFQRFLNRGARYKKAIQKMLIDSGLSPDLYYLGIVESGYQVKAVSRVGAVGPWQFMRPTAREYGLKVNYYIDERQDPLRSTRAAIKYLIWLKKYTGSWELTMAAYNAGPGRIRGAIRRGKTRDYWKLVQKRLLPRDTREYFSQFLAAVTIGHNLQKFGFHEKAELDFSQLELISVPSPVRLAEVSRKAQIPLHDLRTFNPHIARGVTPPGVKNYSLWIPKNRSAQTLAAIPTFKKVKGLKKRRYLARFHRVRRGQTLSHIALKYRISVARLKRINRLNSDRIYVGQRLKCI